MSDEELLLGVYDASDPKAIARAKSAAGRRKKADEDVVKAIMKTANGRSWLFRILEACHIFQPSIVIGQPDATAFREGERNVGLRLLQIVQRMTELYLVMIKENTKDNDA